MYADELLGWVAGVGGLVFILALMMNVGLSVMDQTPTFEQRCHDRSGVVLVDNTECVKSEQLERIVID